MTLSFPGSPSVDDTYTEGGRTWRWNGTAWKVVTSTITSGSIGTAELDSNAVTAAKIASGAVTEAKIADSSITTAKIAAGAVVEADIANNAVTTEKLGTDVQLGYRNVIINGGFDVWQRGTTTTVTGSAYLADRFIGSVNGGGGATESRDTDVPSGQGFRYSWKHAATTTNSFSQMGQQIEFVNCKHLQNKTVTISFWAKAINSNAGSTGLSVRTRTIAGVDGVVLFSGSSSATSITLTTSWAKYTITKTLPASFGSLSLEFALGSHVSGDGFFLTGVQLEAGAVATPFEFENISTTLAKCQRYYFRRETSGIAYQTLAGGFNDGTNALFVLEFPVAMRTSPTSFEIAAAANFYLETGGAGVATSVVVSGYRATTTSMQTILSKAGLSAQGANLLSDNTDIAYVAASAELP